MSEVRCPLCPVVVAADGETMLSHRLRDHLAAAHDIITAGGGGHRGPAGVPGPGRSGGSGEGGGVACPFCGARVAGADADGLSAALRGHLEAAHRLIPAGSGGARA